MLMKHFNCVINFLYRGKAQEAVTGKGVFFSGTWVCAAEALRAGLSSALNCSPLRPGFSTRFRHRTPIAKDGRGHETVQCT